MSGSEGEAIAAVVVSYQSASTLDACLLRLRAARGVAQIRVVDNGSDDGTLEILQRHALADPRLRFVANPDNPGFSVACNQGAADAFVCRRHVEGDLARPDHPVDRTSEGGDEEYAFRGCFHEVSPERIVQTFSWEGMPESVALETLIVTDLGDGWTRLHAASLTDSFESRDGWLASGMEIGVNDGYAKLDELLTR